MGREQGKSTNPIHNEDFPRNILTGLAGEENSWSSKVDWISPPTCGTSLDPCSVDVIVGSQVSVPKFEEMSDRERFPNLDGQRHLHVSGDESGGEGINLNVVFGPFVAQSLGQLADASLRGGVWGNLLSADEGVQRGDIDDFTLPFGDHVFPSRLTDKEQRFQVHIHELRSSKVSKATCPEDADSIHSPNPPR